ncbi:MAG: T9SS type A sorting domain-containing protein [Chitinophagales bacterium]|nr:T9SS type A sorting domain-containing protein [Chitinophagales bacterium]
MKTFTILFFLVLSILGLHAQSVLSIEPNSFNLEIALDNRSTASSYVFNNSSVTRTLRWVRIVEGAPLAWSSYVCDKNNCYLDSTNTQTFELSGNGRGLLELTVTPNGTEGTGNYRVLVYDIKDSAAVNAILTVGAVSNNTTGINNPKTKGISIFPIPAKDVLNVSFDVAYNVSSIQVYNMVGQKLKTVAVSSSSKTVAIPVSALNKGMYFIHILSNGKDIATQTFTKE